VLLLFELALEGLDLELLLLLDHRLLHLVDVALLGLLVYVSLLVNVVAWSTVALARECSREGRAVGLVEYLTTGSCEGVRCRVVHRVDVLPAGSRVGQQGWLLSRCVASQRWLWLRRLGCRSLRVRLLREYLCVVEVCIHRADDG
jgi:hypothetical protein